MREAKIEIVIDLSNAAEVAALHTLFISIGQRELDKSKLPASAPIVVGDSEKPEVIVDDNPNTEWQAEELKKQKAREASAKARAKKKALEEAKAAEQEEAEAAEQEEAKPEEGTDVPDGEITKDTLRELFSEKVVDTPTRMALKKKLGELGANNITKLADEHFASLHEFLTEL